MKIYLNDFEVLTLTQAQLDVIANDIPVTELEEDIKRRLGWVIGKKYDACFKRLQDEWMPKLIANGVTSIPTDKDAFANLVFEQPGYRDRAEREADAKAAEEARIAAAVAAQQVGE
jgi:hypothetical protein